MSPVVLRDGPVGIRPRLERHGVRMPRQPRPRREHDVALREGDLVRAVEREQRAVGPVGPRRADLVRIDGLGRESLQARDDGIRRAVADPGRAERAVERARHATDPIEQARFAQAHRRSRGPPAWARPCGSSRVLLRWRTARTPRRTRSLLQRTAHGSGRTGIRMHGCRVPGCAGCPARQHEVDQTDGAPSEPRMNGCHLVSAQTEGAP